MALQSLGGIAALLAVAWLLIENRRAVALREVAAGLALTAVLALLLLKLPQSRAVFAVLTPRRRCGRGGDARRYVLRVRLSRRRAAPRSWHSDRNPSPPGRL
jgi:hypothetical protein